MPSTARIDGSCEVVRARCLALDWRRGELTVMNADTGRECHVTPPVLGVLSAASTPVAAGVLAERTGTTVRLIERLVDRQLLVTRTTTEGHRAHASTFELAVRWRASQVRARSPRPALLPSWRKPPVEGSTSLRGRSTQQVPGWPALDKVLAARRSCRDMADESIPLDALAQILTMSTRVRAAAPDLGESWRPYPSAGGRHPLEIYALAYRVRGLASGAYWYSASDQQLAPVRPADEHFAAISRETRRYTAAERGHAAPVVLVITAVFDRMDGAYEPGGLPFTYIETGALVQTLSLCVAACGLGGCAIGGRGGTRHSEWLGLDPLVESEVVTYAIGHPRSQ